MEDANAHQKKKPLEDPSVYNRFDELFVEDDFDPMMVDDDVQFEWPKADSHTVKPKFNKGNENIAFEDIIIENIETILSEGGPKNTERVDSKNGNLNCRDFVDRCLEKAEDDRSLVAGKLKMSMFVEQDASKVAGSCMFESVLNCLGMENSLHPKLRRMIVRYVGSSPNFALGGLCNADGLDEMGNDMNDVRTYGTEVEILAIQQITKLKILVGAFDMMNGLNLGTKVYPEGDDVYWDGAIFLKNSSKGLRGGHYTSLMPKFQDKRNSDTLKMVRERLSTILCVFDIDGSLPEHVDGVAEKIAYMMENFYEIPNQGLGNCICEALLDTMDCDDNLHQELRIALADFEENMTFPPNVNKAEHIGKLRVDRQWCGNMELRAFSNLKQCKVVVFLFERANDDYYRRVEFAPPGSTDTFSVYLKIEMDTVQPLFQKGRLGKTTSLGTSRCGVKQGVNSETLF